MDSKTKYNILFGFALGCLCWMAALSFSSFAIFLGLTQQQMIISTLGGVALFVGSLLVSELRGPKK